MATVFSKPLGNLLAEVYEGMKIPVEGTLKVVVKDTGKNHVILEFWIVNKETQEDLLFISDVYQEKGGSIILDDFREAFTITPQILVR